MSTLEKKPVILVVDDLIDNLDIITHILKDKYTTKVATSGKIALNILKKESEVELILLDILMPEMNGYEVCKKLKSNPSTKKIPIIFISAMPEHESEAKGFDVGAVDFISKPINPSILKARVKNHLLLNNQARHLEELVQEQTKTLNELNQELLSLNEEITATQTEILEKLGNVSEIRSKETGHHVQRVAEYSYLLAKKYALSENEAKLLKSASPMHDIGKIAISDGILKKPGKLTEDEFEQMKNHSVFGYEIFNSSQRSILKAASIISHQHHEKWDGTGYPQGLSGEDIHIFGRITALADVFDALASNRVYKKAWEDQKIFKLFREERGKHFDPKLIDIFFENLDAFLEIKERLKES